MQNISETIRNEFNSHAIRRVASSEELGVLTSAGFSKKVATDPDITSRYPLYKCIKKHNVMKICEKYNLYLASTDRYLGAVPQKNVDEIHAFLQLTKNRVNKDHNTKLNWAIPILVVMAIFTAIAIHFNSSNLYIIYGLAMFIGVMGALGCSVDNDVCIILKRNKKMSDDEGRWYICAPKHDLDLHNSSEKGREIVDDPIVLFAPMKENGEIDEDTLYNVTSWGPEASDVVNELNN